MFGSSDSNSKQNQWASGMRGNDIADFNSEFQSKGGEWLEEEAAASIIHRCATGKPKLTT
jgi:hypothetical protein